MRYADIIETDVVNGDGIGCSLFIQYCPHHCYNCFNQETWDINGGEEFTKDIEDVFINMCQKPYIDHIAILGGEPLYFTNEMTRLLKRLNNEVRKPIYVWTGYIWEELSKEQLECMKYIDILIDGKYIDELSSKSLKWRGSSNQRIIDVQKTLKKNKIILLDN